MIMEPINFENIVTKIKEKISLDSNTEYAPYIPDIVEFCTSKKYLGLSNDPYPLQRIILKTFYRGSPGNEHLKLTQDELKLLEEYKLMNVIEKYYSGNLFRELVLVLGRRSGKTYITSIIAAYEAMKLLECPGGDPCSYYNVVYGNPIFIATVATAADQAKVLFLDIKARLQESQYFKNKIGHLEADRISLLTPKDRMLNQQSLSGETTFTSATKGTVVIMSGHSNSDSLLGKRFFALLFDEVAAYKNTGGASSGDSLYSKLGPGTTDFTRIVGTDDNGKPIRVTESKIVSISSPRAEEGMLFKLYTNAPSEPDRLAFKLPTWRVNDNLAEDLLRSQNRYMTAAQFQMEFGAEFSGTSGEKFIPDHYIDAAIEMGREMGLDQRLVGRPGMAYFAHLDPASTSHNYALVVLHTEEIIQIHDKEGVRSRDKIKLFIVDHIKVWHPSPTHSININEVDQYIIDLAKRFRFAMVTYDDWNSLSSRQKLKAKGIATKVTPFRKHYKMKIYDHLEHLLVNHQLVLPHKGPHAQELEMELKCLKRIYGNAGFQIKPDPEGQITTDDLCDAIAGACGEAIENIYNGYTKGTTVYMPQFRDNNQWSIGRSTYGNDQWRSIYSKFGKG